MTEESNGYVTHKQMLFWLIGSGLGWASLVITVVMFSWEIHASQPHHGAVTDREFERLIDRIDRNNTSNDLRFDRMDNKLDRILERDSK